MYLKTGGPPSSPWKKRRRMMRRVIAIHAHEVNSITLKPRLPAGTSKSRPWETQKDIQYKELTSVKKVILILSQTSLLGIHLTTGSLVLSLSCWHITPVLNDLHWLPITSRIDHKVLCLAYACINDFAPEYLKETIPFIDQRETYDLVQRYCSVFRL